MKNRRVPPLQNLHSIFTPSAENSLGEICFCSKSQGGYFGNFLTQGGILAIPPIAHPYFYNELTHNKYTNKMEEY